ncbi:hypothetical protein R1flu_022699 [Riccia fluitans]|uniref:Pentatricopeptide repeat-containing protein n=1 Tax=Riccia fluitans TaxID=41844 RepID=A0ABD1XQ22_9MARC
MSRWRVILECLGSRQSHLNYHRTGALSQMLNREYSSDIVFPTITSRNGKGANKDPGVFYLTQLFGQLLKQGEESSASKVIRDMKSLDSALTVVVCNYLLNSCSKNRNPKMAKEVWNFMRSNKVRMNSVSYGCLIGALSRGGCIDEATELLKLLSKNNEANLVMYNTVLNGCVHKKNKVHAERCIQLMEKQGISKDERTYVELIKLSGMLGDVSATKMWWTQLAQNFTPSPTARSCYIIALCRTNELTEARQALEDMVSAYGYGKLTKSVPLEGHGRERNSDFSAEEPYFYSQEFPESENDEIARSSGTKISKVFVEDGPDYDDITRLNTYGAAQEPHLTSSSGDDEDESVLFSKEDVEVPGFSTVFSSRGMKLSDLTLTGLMELENAYNSMINAAGKAKDHILAECLFSEMRQLGLKLNIYTYNALLRAVLEGRGVKHGLRILKKMDSTGIKPDVHSLTALLEGYCRDGKLNKAHDVLDYMEDSNRSQHPSCHTYNIFLNACVYLEDSDCALQVFGRMKEFGVAPDICTYIAMFTVMGSATSEPEGSSPWSQQQVAKRVTSLELDMAQSGLQHTRESFTSLMNVLGAHGLTELMLQRLKDAKSYGDDLLDVTAYNIAILNCVNLNQVETAWKVYEQMKNAGFKPDVYTYNILINGCSHDKQMATALELVDTMRQEGLTPDVVTFNTLLKVICRSEQMDVVFDVLKEMTASGVQPDTATFNTILTSASYQKRVDVMEHMVEEMRRRNICPDHHTLLPVVSAYMQAGLTDDAVEALRVLSFRMLGSTKPVDASLQNRDQVQGVIGDLARRNLSLGMNTRELLKDAILHSSTEAFAIYTGALAGLVQGNSVNVDIEDSYWAERLSSQYDQRRTSRFTKFNVT